MLGALRINFSHRILEHAIFSFFCAQMKSNFDACERKLYYFGGLLQKQNLRQGLFESSFHALLLNKQFFFFCANAKNSANEK